MANNSGPGIKTTGASEQELGVGMVCFVHRGTGCLDLTTVHCQRTNLPVPGTAPRNVGWQNTVFLRESFLEYHGLKHDRSPARQADI